MKKKKRNKSNKPKVLLETSVQISKQISEEVKKAVDELYRNNNLYSSNFIKYEFKSGFVKSLIDFYLLVKIYNNPSTALFKWSQSFKPRELKNGLILQGLLQKMNDELNTDNITGYLAKIESIISLVVENFDTNLVSMVGDFASDDISRYDLFDSSKYENFLKLLNAKKGIITLDNFWKQHSEELELLTKDAGIYQKKHQFLYNSLNKIKEDINNATKSTICKKIGDAVIATDTLNTFTIATLDSSFDTLCPVLNKKHIKL